MAEKNDAVPAELVDEAEPVGLKELCERCGVHAETVVELVEAGIIEAHGDRPAAWRFSALAVMRSHKALRLRRDLDLNTPGIAVALDLMDQVETLRHRVAALQQQLEKLER